MKPSEVARWTRAAELLDRILALPVDQRPEAVTRLGGSMGVERELESLLAGVDSPSILDGDVDHILEDIPQEVSAGNALKGQLIDQWELGDEIGRGGMSVVYHASRIGQDFQQHAALKILTIGHLGDNFVTSFVRERQILSDLRHPGIARLIDGGVTSDGAPYLVMEHVAGNRIDRWCRERKADTKRITRLMLRLCDAVAYAHRHLVVHQDINPANVLVDEHDRPVLIDFGIARLLRKSPAARSLRAFTPEYGAPEQLEGGAITTATDVYGLGVLFRKLLGDQALDEDLEAILQKSSQAGPDSRYANARAMADDLSAWLERRPVKARPSTVLYRSKRFVSRNRWGVAASVLVFLSTLGGLGASLWQAKIASSERDLARAESLRAQQATRFLKDLFLASDPDTSRGELISARTLLDQGAHRVRNAMSETPELKSETLTLLGDLYRALGEMSAAEPLLEEAMRLADETGNDALRVGARRAVALNKMEVGAHSQALELAQQAEGILVAAGNVPGEQHALLMKPILFSLTELGRVPEAVEQAQDALRLIRDHQALPASARYHYLYDIANALLIAERENEAEPLLLEAAALEVDLNDDPSSLMSLYSNLSSISLDKGDVNAAFGYSSRAHSLAEEIYPEDHSQRARKLSNLAGILTRLGRYEEAESQMREALAIYRRIYANEPHPRVAAAENNLGRALEEAGRLEAAEPHLTSARELAGELFGREDPRYVIATGNLGNLHRKLGNLERADDLLIESIELRRSLFGPEHRAVGSGLSLLAALRLAQDRATEALDLSNEALDLYRRIEYNNPLATLVTLTRRARALAALGLTDEARDAFREAIELAESARSDVGNAWPQLLAAYADFLVAQADPSAEKYLGLAAESHRELLGADHPATVRIEGRLTEFTEKR